MTPFLLHPTAVCCWCQRALICVKAQWWCQTQACRDRQRECGVWVPGTKKVAGHWLYVPTPKQVVFDTCAAKYVLFGGAAGPGKSHAARWALYRRCLRQPGYEALILRRTFPELEKTHLRRMALEVPLLGGEFLESKRLARWPNGSMIECGHMDDADALSKYLSTEYHCIVPDEGSTFDPNPLLELSTRARKMSPDGREKGKFWVVSNPGGPASSMLLDFFIDHAPDFDAYPRLRDKYDGTQWTYIPAQLDDNPYLDPDYEASLAVLQPWRYDQLRHGDWRVFSGQFFATFNERRHVQDLGTPSGVPWFRALDWGFNQPGCWGWYGILNDGRIYKRLDRKFQGESVQANAAALKTTTVSVFGSAKVHYNVGDPAIWQKTGNATTGRYIGQSIGETFTKFGIHLGRADNDRYNGWMRIHDVLRDAPDTRPWFVVHPDCRYTIRSLATARSDPGDPDDVNTESDDHALDETRFALMSRPSVHDAPRTKRYAAGTMGYERQRTGRRTTRLGSESVRVPA